MRMFIIGVTTVLLGSLATTAGAASCTIRGISRTCEVTFTGSGAVGSWCDSNGDGYCTICGGTASQTIFGSAGNDWICGKGGNDVIYGAPPFTTAGGDDVISGDGGNDEIYGGDGDDELLGGSGNDTIWGGNGTNALIGGTGDDTLDDSPIYATLGGTLCGGAGDDTLTAQGIAGWFCLDGGKDQVGPADCVCNNFSIATCTARYCADPVGDFTDDSPCGCED